MAGCSSRHSRALMLCSFLSVSALLALARAGEADDCSAPSQGDLADSDDVTLMQLNLASSARGRARGGRSLASEASEAAVDAGGQARLGALACLWRNSTAAWRGKLQQRLLSMDDGALATLVSRGSQEAVNDTEVKGGEDVKDPEAKGGEDKEVEDGKDTEVKGSKDVKSSGDNYQAKAVEKAERLVKEFQAVISSDLEGTIKGAVTLDQQGLDQALSAFATCTAAKDAALAEVAGAAAKGAAPAAALVQTSKSSVLACREEETLVKMAMLQCKTALTELSRNKTETCKLVTNIVDFGALSECSCEPYKGETYPDFLLRQSAYYQALHQQFKQTQLLCEQYTSQLLQLTTTCGVKTLEYTQKQLSCKEREGEFCMREAALVASSKAACEQYGTCYSASKLAFQQVVAGIKAKEADRLKEWNSTARLKCFMAEFSKRGRAICQVVDAEPECETPECPYVYIEELPAPEACVPMAPTCHMPDEKPVVGDPDEKVPLPEPVVPVEPDEKLPLPEPAVPVEPDEKLPLPEPVAPVEPDEKLPLPEPVVPGEPDEKLPLPELPDKAPLPDKVVPQATTPGPSPGKPAVPDLTCHVTCDAESGGAEPVVLAGADAGLTIEKCRELCDAEPTCEGIEYTPATAETGPSSCSGRRDIHTSKCQPATGSVTEIFGTPWGKCMSFGDPHVFAFDRSHGPKVNFYQPGEYYLVNSSQVSVQGRFGYAKDYPAFSSTVGVAVGGPLLEGHTLYVAYVGPTPGWKGFKVLWDGSEILGDLPSTFSSKDGLMSGKLFEVEPTNYHKMARDTIGKWGEVLPSYYFTLPGLNIYVLTGYDSCNVVLEMQKLSGGQDGFCGNFNCDVADDDYASLEARGMTAPVAQPSLFSSGPAAPEAQYKKRKGAKRLETCPHELRSEAAGACKDMDEAMEDSCIFDVCAAGNVTVAKADVFAGAVGEAVEKDIAAKEEMS